jgi:hypothetical protein
MNSTMMSTRLSPLSVYVGGGFLLHLLWENFQAPLYAGYTSLRDHFLICFKATLGDLLFMFIIYTALAIVHRDPFWVAERSAYAHPVTWIITLLVSALLAVSFELWAVYVDHRWQYTEAMPLIPILQIGLTPVLQMLLIPLSVLFLISRSSRLV